VIHKYSYSINLKTEMSSSTVFQTDQSS